MAEGVLYAELKLEQMKPLLSSFKIRIKRSSIIKLDARSTMKMRTYNFIPIKYLINFIL
jgi:hypothetical protein